MNIVAALGYITKLYKSTKNPHTGKILGSFHWWWVLVILLGAFMTYLMGTSTVWGIIWAVVVIIMGIVWYLQPPQ
jgi:uncharacterized membrane protein (DUF485 family)